MPGLFHSKINIRVKSKSSLFFLIECLAREFNRRNIFVAFYQKKLHPGGLGGMKRFPQLNLPSAVAVAKQVYRFLFADWGFSNCF